MWVSIYARESSAVWQIFQRRTILFGLASIPPENKNDSRYDKKRLADDRALIRIFTWNQYGSLSKSVIFYDRYFWEE